MRLTRQTPGRPARAGRAFTLVELLVVIGIITLLIGILLPSLNRARAAAQQAVCLSNLRQIAIACYTYASENRNTCVPSAYCSGWFKNDTIDGLTGVGDMSWNYEAVTGSASAGKTASAYSFKRGFLGRYLTTDKVLECPTMAVRELPKEPGQPATTYALALIGAVRFSQVKQASETAIAGDAITVDDDTGELRRPIQLQRPGLTATSNFDTFHGRHVNGRGNLAFFDGHAENVLAQRRTKNTYGGVISASRVAMLQANHIGPVCPVPIDFTLNNAAYTNACSTTYDYYFWSDKTGRQ